MATYSEVSRIVDGIAPGLDIICLLIAFEKPVGVLRSGEEYIANNNGGAFPDFPIGVIEPALQPAFFQAYADRQEASFDPDMARA